MVENPEASYNRIGTPKVSLDNNNREYVFVDPNRPAVFVEERKFTTGKGSYTNLIYRIHFQEIPPDLMPFRLGAGKNVGLLVIVTLDRSHHPVLYTTVHTCGCYLAFFPTSYLAKENFPEKWPVAGHVVYGVKLPAFLTTMNFDPEKEKLAIFLQDGSHRVKDVFIAKIEELQQYESAQTELYPMDNLEKMPVDGGFTSFYHESGRQQGYVKNNSKFRERLLMSWWTFDWRIGEDKKLGKNKQDPPVFFTSLKIWARERSDLRDFQEFLAYWGWNL